MVILDNVHSWLARNPLFAILALSLGCGRPAASKLDSTGSDDASAESLSDGPVVTSDDDGPHDTGLPPAEETGADEGDACDAIAISGRVVDPVFPNAVDFYGHWFGPYDGPDFGPVHTPIWTEDDGSFAAQLPGPGRHMVEFLTQEPAQEEGQAYLRPLNRFEIEPCTSRDLGTLFAHRPVESVEWQAGAPLALTVSSELTLNVPASGVEPPIGLPGVLIGWKEVPEEEWPLHPFEGEEELIAAYLVGSVGTKATQAPFVLEFDGQMGQPLGTHLRVYEERNHGYYDPSLIGEFIAGEAASVAMESLELRAYFVVRVN